MAKWCPLWPITMTSNQQRLPRAPRHRYQSGLMEHFIAGFQSHVFLVDILIEAVATL